MWKKFCEVSSCNGVVDLYEARNNKCHFTFWSIVMTLMVCASAYFTYATIRGYLSTPSVTNVETVSEKSLDMPEVLICYNGGLNISAMLAANLSRELIKILASKNNIKPSQAIQDELLTYMSKNNLKLKDIYGTFSYTCEQMVKLFGIPDRWGMQNNDSRCDVAVPVWTLGGICYLFKSNGVQTMPGNNAGLEIEVKGIAARQQDIFTREEQISMQIINDYSISMEKSFGQQTSDKGELKIPLNSYVIIALNTKRHIRLPKYDCDNRDEMYTSNTCYHNCYVDAKVKTCKCLPNYFPHFARYPEFDVCNPMTEQICQPDASTCQYSCRPKCDEWIFENSFTMSTLFDEEVNENSTTHVSIRYDTLQYTKIEEVEAFTIDMAIANVGGQSGLWLGASFVTLIQALYYLVLALMEKLRKKTTTLNQAKVVNVYEK